MKTKRASRRGTPAGAVSRQRALTRAVEDAVTQAIASGPSGSGRPAVAELQVARPEGDDAAATSLRDVRAIRELARVVQEFDIAELELEVAGDRLRLRRGPLAPAPAAFAAPASYAQPAVSPGPPYAPSALMAPAPPAAAGDAPAASAPAPAAARPAEAFITSPFVGTFYRAPSPEALPFVEVGALIKKGQPLCIVEAMKLMNEIEAEQDGRITAVLAQNGQPVEYGEKLFSLEVLDS